MRDVRGQVEMLEKLIRLQSAPFGRKTIVDSNDMQSVLRIPVSFRINLEWKVRIPT